MTSMIGHYAAGATDYDFVDIHVTDSATISVRTTDGSPVEMLPEQARAAAHLLLAAAEQASLAKVTQKAAAPAA